MTTSLLAMWTFSESTTVHWALFNAFVVAMLVLDLKVFHRKAHEVKVREAVAWSVFWIALALVFNGLIYYWEGKVAAQEFLAGYLLEKSLSVDNLFVFLLLFSFFRVKPEYQHRVLFWGILGAIVMRAVFILLGVALISKFHWLMYLFGAFLLFTGAKMAFKSEESVHPEKNVVLRLCRKFLPVTRDYVESRMIVRVDGKLMVTPLFIVLLVVETTDVAFATDSIPAILGITQDPFIVYSSNVFAILGLRALYFALAGLMQTFHLLHYGLSAILVFIGAKMIAETGEKMHLPSFDIPTGVALGVIAGVLAVSVAASLIFPSRKSESPLPAATDAPSELP